MSAPSPAMIAKIAQRKRAENPVPPPPAPPKMPVIAQADPAESGKRVTLGTREEVVTTIHDGVVKTKHLRVGARVRPYVKGQPRGSERIVKSVKKVDNGAFYHVEWATPHPNGEIKAAYRWFDASLVGVEVGHIVRKPAFVAKED